MRFETHVEHRDGLWRRCDAVRTRQAHLVFARVCHSNEVDGTSLTQGADFVVVTSGRHSEEVEDPLRSKWGKIGNGRTTFSVHLWSYVGGTVSAQSSGTQCARICDRTKVSLFLVVRVVSGGLLTEEFNVRGTRPPLHKCNIRKASVRCNFESFSGCPRKLIPSRRVAQCCTCRVPDRRGPRAD